MSRTDPDPDREAVRWLDGVYTAVDGKPVRMVEQPDLQRLIDRAVERHRSGSFTVADLLEAPLADATGLRPAEIIRRTALARASLPDEQRARRLGLHVVSVASGHALPGAVPPSSCAAAARRAMCWRAEGSNAVRIAAATILGPRIPSTMTSEVSRRCKVTTSRSSKRAAPSSPPPACRIARRARPAEIATTSSASCRDAAGLAPSTSWT